MPRAELQEIAFASRADWERWLEANHASSPGLWIRFAKKGSGIASVSHAEALEEALRYGWIDGQARRVDDEWYLQRFTPRRPRSSWSKVNAAKAEELIARGLMEPAGLREVERARADGRWEAAYEPPSRIQVPPDLERELERDAAARATFEGLDSQNRYAILYRLQDAKRPETRERRLRQFLEMLREGRGPHSR